jgi:hypothetical protein
MYGIIFGGDGMDRKINRPECGQRFGSKFFQTDNLKHEFRGPNTTLISPFVSTIYVYTDNLAEKLNSFCTNDMLLGVADLPEHLMHCFIY